MEKEYRRIICGPTGEMIRFIKDQSIDIDIEKLEILEEKVKSIRNSLHPEFIMESKIVREKLKCFFEKKENDVNNN